VADTFEIVTSGLLLALMSGNRGISSSTSQILTILIWDMLTGAILVALGKTEIDDVDLVSCRLSSSDEKVIRLDIAMDDSLGMNLLKMVHKLNGN